MGSSFKKVHTGIPATPSLGGTGVTSLTNGGVLIGAGTNSFTTVSPGASGDVLVFNGTSWTSGSLGLSDESVTYEKLGNDLVLRVGVTTNNIDWSLGAIYLKILNENTSLTFSNYQLDKMIILEVSGNYSLALPSSVNILNGIYDGSKVNFINLHCTDTTSGSEKVWATISQIDDSVNDYYGYGYFAGGYSSSYSLNTDRIVFSTGATSANTVSNLSMARSGLASLSDGNTYGYFAGGSSGALIATADRIIFSTGATSANTVSNLSEAKYRLAGLSDGNSYGYFAGGSTGVSIATAERIVFSTGVTSVNTVSNLSEARQRLIGVSDGNTYGYFAGGDTVSDVSVSTADRIVFSTGATSANTVSNLSGDRQRLTGLSDSGIYGYFAGGYTGGYVATVDRIVFSTGVTSANTVSNLSEARSGLAGVSDGNIYGYFAGGYTGAAVATAEQISFPTGTTSANTVSNLSASNYLLAGLSDCAV